MIDDVEITDSRNTPIANPPSSMVKPSDDESFSVNLDYLKFQTIAASALFAAPLLGIVAAWSGSSFNDIFKKNK